MIKQGKPFEIIGTTIYWITKTLTIVFKNKEEKENE